MDIQKKNKPQKNNNNTNDSKNKSVDLKTKTSNSDAKGPSSTKNSMSKQQQESGGLGDHVGDHEVCCDVNDESVLEKSRSPLSFLRNVFSKINLRTLGLIALGIAVIYLTVCYLDTQKKLKKCTKTIRHCTASNQDIPDIARSYIAQNHTVLREMASELGYALVPVSYYNHLLDLEYSITNKKSDNNINNTNNEASQNPVNDIPDPHLSTSHYEQDQGEDESFYYDNNKGYYNTGENTDYEDSKHVNNDADDVDYHTLNEEPELQETINPEDLGIEDSQQNNDANGATEESDMLEGAINAGLPTTYDPEFDDLTTFHKIHNELLTKQYDKSHSTDTEGSGSKTPSPKKYHNIYLTDEPSETLDNNQDTNVTPQSSNLDDKVSSETIDQENGTNTHTTDSSNAVVEDLSASSPAIASKPAAESARARRLTRSKAVSSKSSKATKASERKSIDTLASNSYYQKNSVVHVEGNISEYDPNAV